MFLKGRDYREGEAGRHIDHYTMTAPGDPIKLSQPVPMLPPPRRNTPSPVVSAVVSWARDDALRTGPEEEEALKQPAEHWGVSRQAADRG